MTLAKRVLDLIEAKKPYDTFEDELKFKGHKVYVVANILSAPYQGSTHSGGPDDSELPEVELESVHDDNDKDIMASMTPVEITDMEDDIAQRYFDQAMEN